MNLNLVQLAYPVSVLTTVMYISYIAGITYCDIIEYCILIYTMVVMKLNYKGKSLLVNVQQNFRVRDTGKMNAMYSYVNM